MESSEKPALRSSIVVLAIISVMILVFFIVKTRHTRIPSEKTGVKHFVGQKIDSFNGVYVYYNGSIANVSGRNMTKDGYNLGQKYQCVEFVKRYYYEYLNHKMPDSYGHAKDFFDKNISDGKKNHRRNLLQFTNPSKSKPRVNDLVVFGDTGYGHVGIISAVKDKDIEVIQQNMGAAENSRMKLPLEYRDNMWFIRSGWDVGWLRKK